MKTKKLNLACSLTALSLLFVLPSTGVALKGVRAIVEADVQMSVSIGEGISAVYAVELPSGYTDAEMTVNGEKLPLKIEEDGRLLFTYRGISVQNAKTPLTASLTAVGENGREQIGEKSYSLSEYWHKAFDLSNGKISTASGVKERAEYISSAALCANYLGYLSAYGAYSDKFEESLSAEETLALYSYDQNFSGGENAPSLSGDKAVLKDIGVNYEDFSLSFSFETAEEDVDVVVQTGTRRPYEVSCSSEGNTYRFTTHAIKPTEFCEDTVVKVYSGEEEIWQATYSYNDALDKRIRESENEKEQTLAKRTYALGKAAAFSAYSGEDGIYTYLPELNDNGILAANVFDYRYDDERMVVNGNLYAPSTVLWVDGKAYGQDGGEDNGVQVRYADGAFTLLLDDAKIDTGVLVRGADLNIVVKENSYLCGSVWQSWDGKAADKSATVLLSEGKNLSVTGTEGKTLFLNGGGVFANTIAVEKVTLESTVSRTDRSAFSASGNIEVKSGGLAAKYTGKKPSLSDGIRTNGNLTVLGGKVSSENFYNGINLTGGQKSGEGENTAYSRLGVFTLSGSGEVEVKAVNAGLAMLPPSLSGETLANSTNGEAKFISGRALIAAKYAVAFADISLTNANVTLSADGGAAIGYLVEWVFWDGYNVWQTSKNVPAALHTDSGDFKKGTLTINAKNSATGIFTNGADINGGTVTVNMNSSCAAFSVAEKDTTLSFDNTDVFVYYTGEHHHHLIDCGSYTGVSVTLTSWAQIKGYGVAMPVSSYGGAVIRIDKGNFVVYNAQARVGEWETNATFSDGSDEIKYRT